MLNRRYGCLCHECKPWGAVLDYSHSGGGLPPGRLRPAPSNILGESPMFPAMRDANRTWGSAMAVILLAMAIVIIGALL